METTSKVNELDSWIEKKIQIYFLNIIWTFDFFLICIVCCTEWDA